MYQTYCKAEGKFKVLFEIAPYLHLALFSFIAQNFAQLLADPTCGQKLTSSDSVRASNNLFPE
jgi:hypothetical protein